jgi:hypothetical protein
MEQVLSFEEMEAGLSLAGPSPSNGGRLEMIVRRPDVNQREVLAAGELSPEAGLAGDNWVRRGSRSTPDGSSDPGRQITLMNSRLIQVLAQDPARWPLAGDQLFVDMDLSEENLPAGQRIAIGEALLEISGLPHTGCAKFAERFGADALRFVNSPDGRRARHRGLNARVIQGGAIRQGDIVRKV